jgi:pantoate--beta-alanine ligase
MRIVRTAEELSDLASTSASAGGPVLVPTMGGLHEGHAALIRRASEIADRWSKQAPDHARPKVVASVFVNPTQFNVRTDFERYPRDLDADAALCMDAGADAIFAPSEKVVYPDDEPVPVPELPDAAVNKGLEDAHRPGHFAGVCQVVRRLFVLCKPCAAVFGEKDWQQLQVVRQMVAADSDPVVRRVVVAQGATVREQDGLAMSSRNRFLDKDSREKAGAIAQALCDASGAATIGLAETLMHMRLESVGARIDYATVRHAEALTTLAQDLHRSDLRIPARSIVAARFGDGDREVRLLDNAPWPG